MLKSVAINLGKFSAQGATWILRSGSVLDYSNGLCKGPGCMVVYAQLLARRFVKVILFQVCSAVARGYVRGYGAPRRACGASAPLGVLPLPHAWGQAGRKRQKIFFWDFHVQHDFQFSLNFLLSYFEAAIKTFVFS